jgi:hypothetical protein
VFHYKCIVIIIGSEIGRGILASALLLGAGDGDCGSAVVDRR